MIFLFYSTYRCQGTLYCTGTLQKFYIILKVSVPVRLTVGRDSYSSSVLRILTYNLIQIQDLKKKLYGSRSRLNFDTDPDPGKNDTDPDPGKKGFSTYQENQKNLI